MDSRILVTGGAGYIGSHACKALRQAGYLPVTFDNLSTGYDWAVKWGPLEVGDIRDTASLERVMRQYDVQGVMHFAAKSLVAESSSDPLLYHVNNVGGTFSLIDAMLKTGIKRIVFSSTCAVYGIPDRTPIDEEALRRPINPYGQSKLAAENVLADVAQTGKLDVALLRYFNAAGADGDLEIGEAHDPESHLIPLAIRAARGTGQALHVFGSDYPTADGTCLRDYIHVSDLAMAHIAALRHLAKAPGVCCFNLGTGQGVSVRQVLDAVAVATGRSVPVVEAPRRAGDPPILFAANERARQLLQWSPKKSDIQTIVASAAAWEAVYQARNAEA